MTSLLLVSVLAGGATLAVALVAVRLARSVRARRRAKDDAVWRRTFDEAGGSVVRFAGYDAGQQARALGRVRAAERLRLRQLRAKTKHAKTSADVVSIASRKAVR